MKNFEAFINNKQLNYTINVANNNTSIILTNKKVLKNNQN